MRETTTKISQAEFNSLMKWSRTEEGYTKVIKGDTYEIRLNREVKEWHLYVNGEWGWELRNAKHGKLLAIAEANNLKI